MRYVDALTEAMTVLAADPRVVLIGQAVRFHGTFMSTTLGGVPLDKRIEFPVAEECQLGVSIGLALTGLVPVSIYPRFQFLLLAMNQLVNHVDVMQPKVIVRVGVGSTIPLDPGPQHKGDLTDAFRLLLKNTPVIRLDEPSQIVPAYLTALERDGPTVLVEVADLYSA